jgi:hypothetical protein
LRTTISVFEMARIMQLEIIGSSPQVPKKPVVGLKLMY